MNSLYKLWSLAFLLLLGVVVQVNAQTVTYGFVQNPSDPVEITAVAYPDFTSSNVTMVTSVFTFLLPAGTVTNPSIPVAPGSGSFTDLSGSDWTAQLLTPAVYATATGQPAADLQGYDVYQVVLQNSPEISTTAGTPIPLFRLRLTNDCIGGNVEVLTNNGAIQQAILTYLSANFNNQMSMSVNDAPATDIYNGNDPVTFSYPCPLDDIPNAMDDLATTDEDMAVTVSVIVNDDFGNNGLATSAISIVGVPINGTAVVNDNGTPNDPTDDTVTFTPNANFNGIGSFVYQICDFDGDCDQATVTVTVNAVNDNPDAVDDLATTDEDMAVDIDVLANDTDIDGNPLTITAVSTPANGTAVINDNGTPADPSDDYVVYTPNPNFFGMDSFTYTISDGQGGTDMATVTVTVNPINDGPDAVDDMATTDEDMAVDIDVLANDVDIDGNPLTITSVSTPANGTAVINDNGTPGDPSDDYVVYTPDPNFFGMDSFTYTISDGQGGTDMATVTVTINSVDDGVTAIDDPVMTDEDTPLDIDVTDNDIVPDEIGSVTVEMQPDNGTAVVNDNGTPDDPSDDYIVYTPDPDFTGTDTFTYQVCDADNPCDDGCEYAITPANGYNPSINPARTGFSGVACVGCSVDMTGNVIDNDTINNFATIDYGLLSLLSTYSISINVGKTVPAGDTVGFAVEQMSFLGLLDANILSNIRLTTYLNGVPQETLLANSSLIQITLLGGSNITLISFKTALEFNEVQISVSNSTVGIDFRVYYAFVRPSAECDTATVTVTVKPADDAIVAMDDVASVDEDMSVNVPVLDNDNIPDGVASITIPMQPTNGTAVVNDNGTPADPSDDYIIYTPDPNFFGMDSFTYEVCDVDGDCDQATVTVTVNPVDDAAVAVDDVASVDEDMSVDIPVLDNDNIPDGVASITIPMQPTNGTATVNDNGTPGDPSDDYVVYTPDPNFFGMDSFTYEVCDVDGDCDQATVTVTVNPVDDAAVAVDDVASVDEDMSVNVPVLDNDNIPDGVASITIPMQPTNGTAVVNDNGTPADPSDDYIIYTPDPNFFGMDSFIYEVCDVDGDCDQATVTVTVNPVDDAVDAVDDAASTPENTPTDILVQANDNVPDGVASITIPMQPTNGTATVNDNGTPGNPSDDYIIYTPNTNFTGMDIFTYQVCDVDGDCDQATVTVTVGAVYVRLLAKMQLQGALLNSLDALMRDDLRQDGVIPTTEPYTALPGFTHVGGGGGEAVTSMAVFNDFGANSIVDWVFVELRDQNNPATVVATRAALLQRDGDVVDVDGVSPLLFSQSVAGSYYVAVRHRNHLGTMTAVATALSATGTLVDFTDTNLDLYNIAPQFNGREQVTISGKYALWAGNSNANKSVVYAGENNDKDPVFNEIDQAPGNIFKLQTYIYAGYRLGDVKLDGASIYAGQNNDVDPIFNNVDGHPANILKLQTFIIPEQLAN